MYRNSPIIRWRRYPERYRFEGNQCTKCKKINYPKKYICECNSKEFKPFTLSGKGKVLTFTEISAAAEMFSEQAPFFLGIIQLEEGPKITSQISDVTKEELKIGLKVQASFRKFYTSGKKGIIHYGTKFIPEF